MSSSNFCGLDFGTSNSTIGVYINAMPELIPMDDGKPIIRSAIFCDHDLEQYTFGQLGVDTYLQGGYGRLMMSLKSVLGSSLMEDKTVIFNRLVSYKEILGNFIRHIKISAENYLQSELTRVVMGRPVRFHDSDIKKDQLAQKTLEVIAQQQGFKEITFQYEPIAAALTYEQSITCEQNAMIIDMGGGTSDFSVIKLKPGEHNHDRKQDVLSNHGIHIGGTDFDRRLNLFSVMPELGKGSIMQGSSGDITVPSSYYHDLTTWHTVNNLYSARVQTSVKSNYTASHQKHLIERLLTVLEKRLGHQILIDVELAKRKLSDMMTTDIDLSFIESELAVSITRDEFYHAIEGYLDKLLDTIKETMLLAKLDYTDIHAIFYTGGTTNIPIIRTMINTLFPQSQIIYGNVFGSVGLGLTIDAKRKFDNKVEV